MNRKQLLDLARLACVLNIISLFIALTVINNNLVAQENNTQVTANTSVVIPSVNKTDNGQQAATANTSFVIPSVNKTDNGQQAATANTSFVIPSVNKTDNGQQAATANTSFVIPQVEVKQTINRQRLANVNNTYIIPQASESINYQQLLDKKEGKQDAYASIPQIGNSASGEFSIQEEYEIGQSFIRQVRKNANLVNDPFIIDYVEQLLKKLARHNNQLQDYRFNVIIINDANINAFAAPGGVIGVNTGLFKYSDNEGGFAAVMAHELAHLSQRHFARRQQRGSGVSGTNQLLIFLSAILLAQTKEVDTDVVQAGLLGATSLVIDKQLQYSRSDEQEADRVGFETLVKANYAPIGAINVFEKLAEDSNSRLALEYLSSHPTPDNRIADFASRFSLSRQREGLLTTLMFQLLKLRVKNIHNEVYPIDVEVLTRQIAKKISDKIYDGDLIKQYYILASQLKHDSNFEQAFTAYRAGRKLLKRSSPAYNLLLAEEATILIQLNRQEEILDELRSQYEFTGNNYPLSIMLSKVYQSMGDYEESTFILQDLRRSRNYDPYVWEALSQNHLVLKNNIDYHRSMAEYYSLTANYGLAIEHLNLALNGLEEKDWTIRVAIEERLNQLVSVTTEEE